MERISLIFCSQGTQICQQFIASSFLKQTRHSKKKLFF